MGYFICINYFSIEFSFFLLLFSIFFVYFPKAFLFPVPPPQEIYSICKFVVRLQSSFTLNMDLHDENESKNVHLKFHLKCFPRFGVGGE